MAKVVGEWNSSRVRMLGHGLCGRLGFHVGGFLIL
jgi:hypothetical protein